ncbi:MAG: aldehyde dehydrogenase family protein, partial [Verrucomicrobia bacterium]|nr:aldehyde dehydrogenase family protein [Verrucomicrobiota bacterium]
MEKLSCFLAGRKVESDRELAVRNPWQGQIVASVALADRTHVDQAVRAALDYRKPLTRFERSAILDRARDLLEAHADAFARLITSESGLCIRESRYEVGRTRDVLRFSAMEALRDDGQIFSGDISPQGKARKIFTLREPLSAIAAITPFNHPLNQVAHKVAPAIAAGAPIILKPSEKTPLTALKFAELLYEAGLPGPMLSVLLGPAAEVAEPLVQDPRVELVAFTGSVSV